VTVCCVYLCVRMWLCVCVCAAPCYDHRLSALAIQHSERVFAAILGVCMGRRLQPGKGRGVMLAVAGILVMLWFSPAHVHVDPAVVPQGLPVALGGDGQLGGGEAFDATLPSGAPCACVRACVCSWT
jgi:hypothetical protein